MANCHLIVSWMNYYQFQFDTYPTMYRQLSQDHCATEENLLKLLNDCQATSSVINFMISKQICGRLFLLNKRKWFPSKVQVTLNRTKNMSLMSVRSDSTELWNKLQQWGALKYLNCFHLTLIHLTQYLYLICLHSLSRQRSSAPCKVQDCQFTPELYKKITEPGAHVATLNAAC